ncbi:4Fe-4S dicluster domain-containing protein, partial [bacterium]|nr:4Fe-4S dicluster domain-containing protein [bacterium]
MQCENAPCEQVCPVQATVHSDEGINQMIYNRCIGTRYCSANCPYSVRKFNFLDYIDESALLEEQRNPNVSVRARGIMEKCTYCVQRIKSARIDAQVDNRRIQDGEVRPACAVACPTEAIIFGDLNDGNSCVAQLHTQPHSYGLLAELGTVPRTTYLARITNPNDTLQEEEA